MSYMHSDLRRGVSGTLSGPAASQYSPGGSGGGAAYMAAYAQVKAQFNNYNLSTSNVARLSTAANLACFPASLCHRVVRAMDLCL
jgi:hypothetical protein